MYVYEDQVIFRARDFATGEWKPEFDEVFSLNGEPQHTHELTEHPANDATCAAPGNSAYWSCECGKYFSDANGENEIAADSWITPAHGLTHVQRKEATETADGNIEYWYCDDCNKYFTDSNAANEISQADTVIPATGPVTGKLGDADGDGHIDAFDASQVVKFSVGSIGEDDLDITSLDVDGDGHVDAYDAALIQKFSVGAIDKFPIEEEN